jgi:cytochrome P450
MSPDWGYHHGFAPFARLGETFLLVAYDKVVLFTCHADLIHQVTTRREDFPKPLASYKILDLFGSNVVTTEGQLWRMHRKVTAASFNERNAAGAFAEAIAQAQGMLSKWFPRGNDSPSTETIRTLEQDTMRWALNIIAYVGFGLRFLWPHQDMPANADPRLLKYGGRHLAPGFTLNFVEAIADMMGNLLTLVLVPWPLLSQSCRTSYRWKGSTLLTIHHRDSTLSICQNGLGRQGELGQVHARLPPGKGSGSDERGI